MKPATVAICDACWLLEEHGRPPVRIQYPNEDTCYRCRKATLSGIYVRRMIEEEHK